MLLFCPSCSNTLTVSRAPYNQDEPDYPNGRNRLECKSCPYQFLLDKRYYERKEMKHKKVEDVIGGKGSWDNVDQTDAQCPSADCEGARAFYYQVQIRSADEPMTTFLKCTTCGTRWKEN